MEINTRKRKPRQDFNEQDDDGAPEEFGEESEYYLQVKEQKEQAKKQKLERKEANSSKRRVHNDFMDENAKRGISNEIESNRGLTRSRPKKTKNPKTRMRDRYETALKKRRGTVRKMVDKTQPYGGETTGIKTNVVRSRSLKN